MPGSLTLTSVRPLDLSTGVAGDVMDLHVTGEVLTRRAGPRAQVIDGQGGVVMPGLWDFHVHMAGWAMNSQAVDVSGLEGALAVATRIAAAAADFSGDVLIGQGFRDSTWPHAPSAGALDAVTGDLPCVILSGDRHSAWMNTAAIARFGLGPTKGMLRENAAFDLQRQLEQVPHDTLDDWVSQAASAAAGRGVVGIVDLTMDWNIGHWQRRFANGFDTLCVRAGTYPQWLDRVREEGFRGGQVVDENNLLTVGPLKVIFDGSLGSGTAWCHEPYGAGVGSGGAGQANVSQDELVGLMRRASSLGMECAIHAIGDRAASQVLDAFAEVGAKGSIEHAQLVRPDDIARMAELGLRASVQPSHLLDDRAALDTLWDDRAADAFPLASMVQAGVVVAMGSDAPVAPLDPWLGIEAAVRRAGGQDEPWHPEQRLTLSQALLASCRGVRSLVAGAEADLVVLPQNPFEMAAETLHTVSPVLTMVGGRVSHSVL